MRASIPPSYGIASISVVFFYCWFLVSVSVTSHLTLVRIVLVMIRLLSGHLFGRLTLCSLCTRGGGGQSHSSQELEILSIILKIK